MLLQLLNPAEEVIFLFIKVGDNTWDGKLNLKAQNLFTFLQLADGVDDATWEHHRGQGDFSKWAREEIKDERLAEELAKVESDKKASPKDTRAAVRAAIETRYTLPADTASGHIE